MKVTIIGGGVIGLCSAYYLKKAGHEVTVIERNNITDGCSFGNQGYVSPSHFIPLATPGIIKQGLKWMMSSSSPFYIKPRLNWDLIRWGMTFRSSATARHVEMSAPHLNNLLQLTRRLMNDVKNDVGHFEFVEKGCWLLWRTEKTGDHEKHLAEQAVTYNLKTITCTPQEVQDRETEVEVKCLGGVLYTDDAHVNAAEFMTAMYQYLQKAGVKFWLNTDVTGFETANGRVNKVITSTGDLDVEELVIANGSWMQQISKQLGIYMPMQPGKGYSLVYNPLEKNLLHPAILVDDRTATTPVDRWLRIGGTMELSGHSDNILPKRVTAIYNNFKKYYPTMNLPEPDMSKAWYGYRPVSPDGMPYIGRHSKYSNLSYAGGHAMIGMTAAAGTGQLIKEIVGHEKTAFDLYAFRPDRFRIH